MTKATLALFLAAIDRPAAEVIAAAQVPDLIAKYSPPKRGEHLRGPRRPERTAVGRGVCSYCREVQLVHEVLGHLCCARCP